jgi:hypothetical protein
MDTTIKSKSPLSRGAKITPSPYLVAHYPFNHTGGQNTNNVALPSAYTPLAPNIEEIDHSTATLDGSWDSVPGRLSTAASGTGEPPAEPTDVTFLAEIGRLDVAFLLSFNYQSEKGVAPTAQIDLFSFTNLAQTVGIDIALRNNGTDSQVKCLFLSSGVGGANGAFHLTTPLLHDGGKHNVIIIFDRLGTHKIYVDGTEGAVGDTDGTAAIFNFDVGRVNAISNSAQWDFQMTKRGTSSDTRSIALSNIQPCGFANLQIYLTENNVGIPTGVALDDIIDYIVQHPNGVVPTSLWS